MTLAPWKSTGKNPPRRNETLHPVFPPRLHLDKLCYQQTPDFTDSRNSKNLPNLSTNIMANIFTLTPEQEFQHRVIQDQAANLTVEDARKLVVEMSRQLMIRNNVLIDLIRRKGV
jgi:Phycobilisome degradation protein nblA